MQRSPPQEVCKKCGEILVMMNNHERPYRINRSNAQVGPYLSVRVNVYQGFRPSRIRMIVLFLFPPSHLLVYVCAALQAIFLPDSGTVIHQWYVRDLNCGTYSRHFRPPSLRGLSDVTVLGAAGKTGRECVEYLASKGTGKPYV